MDLLELSSMTSLPMDMSLPSPWDPDRVMAEAVFGPCADDCQETTIALSGTPTEMPYYSNGSSFLQGAMWSAQALKCSENSSEASAGLVETSSWAPTSSSCVQSSDSGSESLPAPMDVSADATAPPRVVRRSRARRNQHSEPGSGSGDEQAQYQQHTHTAAQVHTLEAAQAPQRPEWVHHKGTTLSGVVRPFESVKGYGMVSGSRTLQEINMALKNWQAA